MLIKRNLSFLIIFLLGIANAQNSENSKLLSQAEEIVFYNPKETFAIAEHVYKNTSDAKEVYYSKYLSALSNYVLGNYDQALTFAFDAKHTAESMRNLEFVETSKALIFRIFQFLMLDVESIDVSNPKTLEIGLQVEDLIRKSNGFLSEDQLDSANFYLNEAKKILNSKSSGYAEALYYSAIGDLKFKNQMLDSSLVFYQKADSIAQQIQNPFLLIEINQRLATNYLAMDDLNLFHLKSQYVNELNAETTTLENQTANRAHALMIADMDESFDREKSLYQNILIVVLIVLLVVVILKLIFHVRNKNKLKMFNQMLSYLNSHQELSKQSLEKSDKKEIKDQKKTTIRSSMLKESELQILEDLRKFEATDKYTSKDMSLAMLASELNTNTKYLSKVINEHKKKNFNAYINELRVNFIVEKMKTEPSYLNYKVSYLAEVCGFSSHSTFTTVFKSIVGVSPITFVEFIREESLEKSSQTE